MRMLFVLKNYILILERLNLANKVVCLNYGDQVYHKKYNQTKLKRFSINENVTAYLRSYKRLRQKSFFKPGLDI